MAFAISSYRLMIHNMTKRPFRVFGLEHLFVIAPTLVNLTRFWAAIDVSENEKYVTYSCLGILVLLFYTHIYLLASQFLARNPDRNFWLIKKKKEVPSN